MNDSTEGAGEWASKECGGCGELWRGTIHFCQTPEKMNDSTEEVIDVLIQANIRLGNEVHAFREALGEIADADFPPDFDEEDQVEWLQERASEALK